jgi:hypothetical protein
MWHALKKRKIYADDCGVNTEGKRSLGIPRRRLEDNIKKIS